ncbi:YfaP family protein [Turneriella parva]|uniref:DUF2135 domain-containing protein n=1 Tax=Turneriella parva (strain ATCC BAA-1111 / DSM 21527 / NCTC 11395 / H) TaxID=869212 RepID=I4B1V8_TURPD|nr:DUF2135 domain-containing protein [Turneriella parva]AFM11265.1 hypothetical protein Turpa_0613 [Turneriella parva DSM 21527]
MTKLRALVIVFTLVSLGLISAKGSEGAGGKRKASGLPEITISAPASGWTALKVVKIEGEVANAPKIEEVRFFHNGVLRHLPIIERKFSQEIVLGSGANYIKVEADNENGTASAALKLVTNNEAMDIKVILYWDTNFTDVDLWVTDPANERVFYGNRRSKIGGELDIDITTGYGPETFTQKAALPGEYLVQVQYYGGAQPTMAKVLVILYEGTEREKRLVMPALLHETGEGITIGKFKVD